MPMFSRKPQLATQTAARAPQASSPFARLMALPVANPYVAAAGAGFLLLGSLAVLIATGDPRAGAPSVRVALGQAASSDIAGMDGGAPELAQPNDIAMVDMSGQSLSENPYEQATITLPDGTTRVMALDGPAGLALTPSPIAGLSQPGPGGPLPVIAADGRTAAQAYARPFVSNGKPKVALIIGGLGLDVAKTQQAIALPPEVTLSFPVTEAANLQMWINLARAHGHEVMLEIPMEPKGYPSDDPGPDTLLANARPEDMSRRLDGLLARATGYFGVTNYQGSKFVTSNTAMDALSTGLRRRGLAFIDDGSAAQRGGGIPRASADRMIDEQLGQSTIALQLGQLEQTATRNGAALGTGFIYPVTIRQVAAWAQGLGARGFQLAPASALTVRR